MVSENAVINSACEIRWSCSQRMELESGERFVLHIDFRAKEGGLGGPVPIIEYIISCNFATATIVVSILFYGGSEHTEA